MIVVILLHLFKSVLSGKSLDAHNKIRQQDRLRTTEFNMNLENSQFLQKVS